MVEAGAREVDRGRRSSRRSRWPTRPSASCAPPSSSCARAVGKPEVVRRRRARDELDAALRRTASTRCSPSTASPASPPPRPRSWRPSCPPVARRRRRGRDGAPHPGRASRSRCIGEERRLAAVQGPLAEQFGDALRSLSDAEQDSKELKSAKRAALYDRIEAELQLPFPARGEAGLDAARRARWVRKAADAVYKQIVRAEDRGREAPPRRPRGRGDPRRSTARSRSRRARTARRSSPAARPRR